LTFKFQNTDELNQWE